MYEGFNPHPLEKDVSAHSAGLLIYVSEGLLAERLIDLETNLNGSLWIEIKH